MSGRFPWGVLGIAQTADKKAIRSAYAARLKALDVDADVAAFEELRAAREEALYLAAQGAEQVGLADDPLPPPDMDWDAPLTADELLPDAQRTPADPAPQPEAEAQPYDERPDRFLALLYPGGEYSGDPLTAEEFAEAELLQRELVAEAQGAAIDKQHGIELWLAHHLASAWPRSGPLVEESGAAFGWDRAAGLLDENPAVAFLNNRLAAIAFVHQLDAPTHPLHNEWVELKKPGTRSPIPWRKARVDKVQQLLTTIRTQHPEVEEYLSPQRVASWGGGAQANSGGSSWWAPLLAGLFLLSIVGRCAGATNDASPNTLPPPPILTDVDWTAQQRLSLIHEVLGDGPESELALLDQDERPLWNEMRTVTRYAYDDAEAPRDLFVERIRSWILVAAPDAPFAQLVEAKAIKLELVRLAREGGSVDACAMASRGGPMPPGVTIPETLRARERALARAMAEGGLFDSLPVGGRSFEANIPGDIFEGVMADTGLSEAEAAAAASGTGPNAAQCAFRIALAERVLRQPGNVSADLLKIL